MFTLGEGSLDQALAELEQEITDIARGVTVAAFNSVLSKSPQFSGALAASWTYSLNTPAFIDRTAEAHSANAGEFSYGDGEEDPELDESEGRMHSALHKGHRTATNISRLGSGVADQRFKLGDTVFISNGVEQGASDYAHLIEEGSLHLRLYNRPGKMVSRTVDQISTRYADIKVDQANRLKQLTIRGGGAE